jgi:PKD repeat protein
MPRLLLSFCLLLLCSACSATTNSSAVRTAEDLASATKGLGALPADGAQPWERRDVRGLVVPEQRGNRTAAAFPASSQLVPGVERFLESGGVIDNGEASTITGSTSALSWAMYRLTMGGVQPGAIGIDANLRRVDGMLSEYWVGVSDYGNDHWQLHGPFNDGQVAFTLDAGDYLSDLGNTFVTIIAHENAVLDVVGVLASPRDVADAAAPPAPGPPQLTPVAGGLEATWVPIIAADVAGYRVYYSLSPFTAADENGVQALPFLEGTTRVIVPAGTARLVWVGLTAVDVNGNESALSPTAFARPGSGTQPNLVLSVSAVGALRNDSVTLTATGAERYDFDTDGDGTFDITGDTTGVANVDTAAVGLIRPRVRASSADGTAVALGSVSLIVSGNQRPVASARVDPAAGPVPLAVNFLGEGADFDGSIVAWAWDRTGDGIYERGTQDTTGNFSAAGFYNAKLRVTDDQGAWDVDTVSINAQALAVQLTASPATVSAGQRVDLRVDVDGTPTLVEWDLDGNGTYETATAVTTATWTSFAEAGSYTVGVQVTTAAGVLNATAAVHVTGWRQVAPPVFAIPESRPAMVLIAGKPAIAWVSYGEAGTLEDVNYVRAIDTAGLQWGTPVTIDTLNGDLTNPIDLSLASINGRPAIAAFQTTGGVLSYVRADNAAGSAWPEFTNIGTGGFNLKLLSAGGAPAIFGFNSSDQLFYMRGLDADGTGWGSPLTLDVGMGGQDLSAVLIAGNPAVAYYGSFAGQLRYRRAIDPAGTTWDPVRTVRNAPDVGTMPDLVEFDGLPALAVRNGAVNQIAVIRGYDAPGSSWSTDVTVSDTGGIVRVFPRLVVNGGVPHVFFSDFAGRVWHSPGAGPGLAAFGVPQTITGELRWPLSALEVEGRIAVFGHQYGTDSGYLVRY